MAHRRKPSGAASNARRVNPLTGVRLWKESYWCFMQEHVPGYEPSEDEEAKNAKKLTPDMLWRLACAYFEAANDDVIIKLDFIKSGPDAGRIIELPTRRPYSLTGFEMYVEAYGIRARLSNFFTNRDSKYPEFEAVCNRIRAQKDVGLYKVNLICDG